MLLTRRGERCCYLSKHHCNWDQGFEMHSIKVFFQRKLCGGREFKKYQGRQGLLIVLGSKNGNVDLALAVVLREKRNGNSQVFYIVPLT